MHHRTGQVFPRWPAATVAAALLLGCHLGDQRDARACPQTGEFGNYGCAVVEGAVVGARGQPLGGVAVAPGPSADGGQFDTPFHYTDASGRFELRLTRYVSAPSDSASVWIHANVLPTPPEVVSTIHDSAHELGDGDFTKAEGAPWNGILDVLAFLPVPLMWWVL